MIQRQKKIDDTVRRKYKCGYCKEEFVRKVRKTGEGKQSGSTQVQCPKCKAFLKTWNEGEIIE